MARRDEFREGQLVWTEDEDVWYPALVEAVNPASLVLEWAEIGQRQWPDTDADRQHIVPWSEGEHLVITAATGGSHYKYWKTHEAFTDVLANGGRNQRRLTLVSRSAAASPAIGSPAVTADDRKNSEPKQNRIKTQSRKKISSPSIKVRDPPLSAPSLSAVS